MKILLSLFLIISLFFLSSCAFTDEQKLEYCLSSENYSIEVNYYGGFVGMSTSVYHLKKNNSTYDLVLNEGWEDQSSIKLRLAQKDSLNLFLKESFKTHDPNKIITASCIGGGDFDYVVKAGFFEKRLRPSSKCDSLFAYVVGELIN